MGYLDKFGEMTHAWTYLLFRVIIGAIFALHGAQKIGLLGGDAMTGLFLFVGICEFLIGLGVLFGVLARLAAAGGIIIMISAYFMAHASKGLIPFCQSGNGGEPALLFLAAFLVVLSLGAGKMSLERAVLKKEIL